MCIIKATYLTKTEGGEVFHDARIVADAAGRSGSEGARYRWERRCVAQSYALVTSCLFLFATA
jgi:hypothetical protein